MSYNRATIAGNVGRDPDIRTTQAGDKIANFSIATSERWTDKATSEKKEATEWHNIVVYNPQMVSGVIEPYVKKGTRLLIEGAIKSRKYTDKDNIERRVTEIVIGRFDGKLVLLGQAQGGAARDEHGYGEQRTRDSGNAYAAARSGTRTASDVVRGTGRDPLDDDIPF